MTLVAVILLLLGAVLILSAYENQSVTATFGAILSGNFSGK